MLTMIFSGRSDSRRWSSVRRRHERAPRIFLLVAALLAVASFFGGSAWQSKKTKTRVAAVIDRASDNTEARTAALAALDEAITAKSEKRTTGALAALYRARRADPSVPVLDVAFAEIALNEKQFIEMRAAAGAAKKKDDHAAGASVLLGMDKWISRGASDREMSSAADAASAHFAEAIEADYFYAPAWFFWGDASRYAGREDEGRVRALAALHRFNPWESSDVIAAKIVFASAEAGDSVFGSLEAGEGSPWAQALEDFGSQNAEERQSPASLAPFAARQTLISLVADPFVSGPKAVPVPQSALPKLP
jgi:hypothetical protein